MKCYSCGSSLVGEEKIKTRKDGTTNTFIYYHCSRQVNYNCSEPYAREEDLIEQLSRACNDLIDDLESAEPNLRKAVDKFIHMIKATQPQLDSSLAIGSYIKYVLNHGTVFEKTRLVRNINKGILLHQRKLIFL